jgi:hypothetical protein
VCKSTDKAKLASRMPREDGDRSCGSQKGRRGDRVLVESDGTPELFCSSYVPSDCTRRSVKLKDGVPRALVGFALPKAHRSGRRGGSFSSNSFLLT